MSSQSLPSHPTPLFTPRPLAPTHRIYSLPLHTPPFTPAPQLKTPAVFVLACVLCAQTLCGPLDPNKVMGIPIKRDASSRDETGSRVKRKASGGFKNSYIQVRCSDQVRESAADWVSNLLFVLRRFAKFARGKRLPGGRQDACRQNVMRTGQDLHPVPGHAAWAARLFTRFCTCVRLCKARHDSNLKLHALVWDGLALLTPCVLCVCWFCSTEKSCRFASKPAASSQCSRR